MVLSRLMQAPIGPATTPGLVAAVSRAGGLGCLAASWTPARVLREQLAAIRAATDVPFCVNLVLAFDQRERLDVVLEERVPAVSFSWGVDPEAIARARAGGAAVLVQVGDAEAGARAAAAGADAVVAQGVEAGGHVQSRVPLRRLLEELRVGVPVYAAGGIASAAAAAVALEAGATGVAAGTAFLAAEEANVHPLYRRRLLEASGRDTCLTGAFHVGWPDAPHRVLRNSTLAGDGSAEDVVATRAGRPIVRFSDAQPTRDTEGNIEAMALYAGAGVGDVRRAEPAAAITARLLAAVTT